MDEKLDRLKELVEKKARQYGNFTLSSELKINHYFDLKLILCDPEGITLTGEKIFESIADTEAKALGGYGLGGCLIVTAVVTLSFLKGKPIPGFEVIDREKLRQNDPQRCENAQYVVKGHLPLSGGKVAIVDDVLSTGKAILIAIEAVESKGCQVVAIRTILDRQLGGSEELLRRGYDFKSFLRADISGNVYIN